jgi:hypothetical protein
MSSTGRKPGKRRAFDTYITPSWAVDRLLDVVTLPGGDWLEPCAGTGAIISAVEARRNDVRWAAVEIQEQYRENLMKLECHTPLRGDVGDFLTMPFEERVYPPLFAVCVINPPYEFASEFILKCRKLAGVTAVLTRVNFLSSKERAEFFRAWMPDIYVLPNRPDFTGEGGDSTEYCWMVFHQMRVSNRGMIQVLALTPPAERKAEKQTRSVTAPPTAPVATFPGFPAPPSSEPTT